MPQRYPQLRLSLVCRDRRGKSATMAARAGHVRDGDRRMFGPYLKPIIYVLALAWVICFAFLVGEGTEQQNERIRIETANKASNAASGPKTEIRTEQSPEVKALGVRLGEATLGFITILLWLATRDLVETSKETARQQLRAYLSIEPGTYYRQSSRSQFEFRPDIINNGHTPADQVRVISNLGVVSPIIPDTFNYELSGPSIGLRSVMAIGPRQKKFHASILQRKLTRAEMREILRGTKCFHLYGTVTYLDIFKIERHTNFSYVIFVSNRRVGPTWLGTERNNTFD